MIGLAITLSWTMASAPPPRYGGEVVLASALTFESGADPADPCGGPDPAIQVVRALRFEPLFDLNLQPVLARSPGRWEGATYVIPLRNNVPLHDGTALQPGDVEAWLESSAACLGIEPLLAGSVPRAISSEPLLGALRIRLRQPIPGFERLLAGPHAGVAVRRDGRRLGTGPFRADPDQPARSIPFLRHPAGRPYLDGVTARPLRRAEGSIPSTADFLRLDGPGPFHVTWWLVQSEPDPELLRVVDGAVDRRRLVERFVPFEARPMGPVFRTSVSIPGAAMDLVLPPERTGSAFRERLQLDLFRADLKATLRSRPRDRPHLRLVASAHVRSPGGQVAEVVRLLGRLGRWSSTLDEALVRGAFLDRQALPLPALAPLGVLPLMSSDFGTDGEVDPLELADHWLPREAPP